MTVLLPVKEHDQEFLREAVGSLRKQTSPRWQALVIAEPGDREALAAAFAEPALFDPRIRVIANRGRKLAGALNTGMRDARSAWTAILFADDMWSADAVEVLERNIRDRPDADFFHSSRRIVDDAGQPISSVHRSARDVRPEDFLHRAPVKHLLCWRRDLALEIGGIDESLNSVGPDDYDFPWSMSEAGARFAAIPECLYIYRDHRSCYRLTTHLPLRTHVRETRRILRKHGVPRAVIRRRVAHARRSYLRQCLYSSRLDAWVKRALGREPARGHRETYL